MKKALELASVASMIDLFNMDNIDILKDLGYKVDVAANFESGSITSDVRVKEFRKELKNDGIRTYHFPIPRNIFKISGIIESYKLIKKLCKDNQYEIIHCHSPVGGVIARLAARETRKNNTKVIYTAHGFHFFKGAPKLNWLLFYPIEKYCSKFTDCIITINKEDYKRAKTKFKAKEVKYIPGIGVHVDEIQNIKVDKVKLRNEFKLKDSDFIIMSIGELSVRKNHKVVIKALSKIHNKKIKYLIIGFGELEVELKSLVKKLNLEDRVVFTGYRKDAKAILHIANIFAFPSLQEGMPVSVMEAMAVGLPIVASNIRGNNDLIENGVNGFLYDCYDIDAFANGILSIYNNQKLAEQMNQNNMYKIINYNQLTVKNLMKNLFMEVRL